MIAVITAGGSVDGELAALGGAREKALLRWRGGALVDPAIEAARGCGASRIVVVGSPAVAAHCGARVDEVLAARATGRENLALALGCAGKEEALLLLCSDLPFLDAQTLGDFVARAHGVDVAMALAEGDDYRARFSGAADHVTRLGRDAVANGSVFLFASAEAARRSGEIATRLFDARKSLVRMAALLELPMLLRFAAKRLRIADLERYAQRKFGVSARGVRGCAPELCYDVDTLDDYRYALGFAAESGAS